MGELGVARRLDRDEAVGEPAHRPQPPVDRGKHGGIGADDQA